MKLYVIILGWGVCFLLAISAAAAGIVVPFFTAWYLFISIVGLTALTYQAYRSLSQADDRTFSSYVDWTWMLGVCFFYFQMCFLHWTGFDSPWELFTRLAPDDNWPALLTRAALCTTAVALMFCSRMVALRTIVNRRNQSVE